MRNLLLIVIAALLLGCSVEVPSSSAVQAGAYVEKRSTQVRVVTANLGRAYWRPAVIRSAADRVRGINPDVVGWQEIDEGDSADEHGILARKFSGNDWSQRATLVPVSSGFDLVRSVRIKGSPGVPGVSPTRWIIVSDFDTDGDALADLRVVNAHLIAGAWSGSMKRQLSRREHWNRGWGVVKEKALQGRRMGLNVLVTMDANRDWNASGFHWDAVVVHHFEVDHLLALPAAGFSVEVTRKGSMPSRIDGHRLLWADVEFRAMMS